VIDEPDELVVAQELKIAGNEYTAFDCPQPLPHDWERVDDRNSAELYNGVLSDFRHGDLFVHSI